MDQCHNEKIEKIPDQYFNTEDFLFQFNAASDDFLEYSTISPYNLIILAHPKPLAGDKVLFKPKEVQNLKKFVKGGGGLLLTMGNRGDYAFPASLGSVRVLSSITGVKQYPYVSLFNTNPENYNTKKTNIQIAVGPEAPVKGKKKAAPAPDPAHPILEGIYQTTPLVFGNSCYLIARTDNEPDSVIISPEGTYRHSYKDKKKVALPKRPLVIANEVDKGRVVTMASSSLFTLDPLSGVEAGGNLIFLKNIFKWLLKMEPDEQI